MPILPCLLPAVPERKYFCSPISVGSCWDTPEHSVYRGKGTTNEFSIHLIVSGKGYVEIEGNAYTLQAGTAFLYFPFEEQRYYSSEEDPWHVKWVHFYGDKLKEFMIEHGFHRSTLWSMNHIKPLEEAQLALYEEAMRHKLLHETKLSALTYAFLVEFMGQAAPFSEVKATASADRIPELLPHMQEKAREPFDLEYWAAQAGVSSYYFCKLFRKTTRMTPLAFITLCRLQYGKHRLLEQLDLPIQQIAKEAGYSSASYFNRRFMEQEGMTPSEFRELYVRKS